MITWSSQKRSCGQCDFWHTRSADTLWHRLVRNVTLEWTGSWRSPFRKWLRAWKHVVPVAMQGNDRYELFCMTKCKQKQQRSLVLYWITSIDNVHVLYSAAAVHSLWRVTNITHPLPAVTNNNCTGGAASRHITAPWNHTVMQIIIAIPEPWTMLRFVNIKLDKWPLYITAWDRERRKFISQGITFDFKGSFNSFSNNNKW